MAIHNFYKTHAQQLEDSKKIGQARGATAVTYDASHFFKDTQNTTRCF